MFVIITKKNINISMIKAFLFHQSKPFNDFFEKPIIPAENKPISFDLCQSFKSRLAEIKVTSDFLTSLITSSIFSKISKSASKINKEPVYFFIK